MTEIYASPSIETLKSSTAERRILLYGVAPNGEDIGFVGNKVRHALRHINLPIPLRAHDFLTIALAVVATDEFVSRSDAPYGFNRDLSVKISVADPKIWNSVGGEFAELLSFLTGDNWELKFEEGGHTPPTKQEKRRLRNILDISEADQVCLFSGGLDSLVGALELLKSKPDSTLLVSRASTGDKKYQQNLLRRLNHPLHLGINDRPTTPSGFVWEKEESTRARSLLFIAMGVCAACAISEHRNTSSTKLYIPENGFIALNPPLTPRRRGANSTRTAHPHYLSGLQEIFDRVSLRTTIENPYRFNTKGEMLEEFSDQALISELAPHTVSCGKWKRRGKQCGKCVPCLIRRGALHRAGLSEPSQKYVYEDLSKLNWGGKDSVDICAVATAIMRMKHSSIARWVSASGPLPVDQNERQKYMEVAQRGLAELETFYGLWK